MSEATLKRFKRLYNEGKIGIDAIQSMLDAGKITEAEYRYIVESNSVN